MNWITFCWFVVFLSCQYSVGHGEGENVGKQTKMTSEEFYYYYYDLVAPVIQEALGCDDIYMNYLQGANDPVCIFLILSLLVFCLLDLMH